MDQFINAAYLLAIELLPIIGVVVLIMVIVLIVKTIKLTQKTIDTLDRSHTTLDLVDKSIEKVQVPLDSAVKISHTVDDVHDATVKAVSDSAAYLKRNKEAIKNKVDDLLKKNKKDHKDPQDMNEVL